MGSIGTSQSRTHTGQSSLGSQVLLEGVDEECIGSSSHLYSGFQELRDRAWSVVVRHLVFCVVVDTQVVILPQPVLCICLTSALYYQVAAKDTGRYKGLRHMTDWVLHSLESDEVGQGREVNAYLILGVGDEIGSGSSKTTTCFRLYLAVGVVHDVVSIASVLRRTCGVLDSLRCLLDRLEGEADPGGREKNIADGDGLH